MKYSLMMSCVFEDMFVCWRILKIIGLGVHMFKKFISALVSLVSFIVCGCSCVTVQTRVAELDRGELAKAYVFIQVQGSLESCDLDGKCETLTAGGSGSGFGVAEDMIMTAAHVCAIIEDLKMYGSQDAKIYGYDIDGNKSEMSIVDMNKESDLCLLKGDGLDSLKVVKIAGQDLNIGDHATLVGAPHGFWSPNMILIFDGYKAGNIDDPMGVKLTRVVYSIFGLPGVSGGMVVNDSGEVIGVAILARSDIQHTIIAVQLKDIQSFAKRNNL